MNKIKYISLYLILLMSCTSTNPMLSLKTEEGRRYIVENIDSDRSLRRRMDITTDSLPGIFILLNHSDPQYRLAGLKIIEDENLDPFYPVVFRKINDSDSRVSEKSFSILKKTRFKSSRVAQDYLMGNDFSLINSSLRFFVLIDEKRMLDNIIQLFKRGDPYLNKQAARAISSLTEWNSPFIENNLDSDIAIATGIIQALSFYKTEEVIPLIMQQLEKKDYNIQTAAQQALLTLPRIPWEYIEEMLTSEEDSKIFAALLVLEKEGKIEDYSLIFPFLESRNSGIRGKARVILITRSDESFPAIIEILPYSSRNIQKELLLILTTKDEVESIPALLDLVGNSSAEISNAAEKTIRKKGIRAIPYLRQALVEGNSNVRNFALTLLLSYKDPGILLEKDSRNLKQETALQLLYQTEVKELKNYLLSLSIGKDLINDLIKLKETLSLIQEIYELSLNANIYFMQYQNWEKTLVRAKILQEKAIDNKHKYFQTKDKNYLVKSRENRQKSQQIEKNAEEDLIKGLSLSSFEISQGKKIIESYNAKRSELVEVSMTFNSLVKPLAEAIYREEGLEISEISREYQIFRRRNPFLEENN